MVEVKKIEPIVTPLKPRKRVAAYARVSMESDRLNHSLSAQVSYFNETIQRNPEWIYAGVYADSGISGGGINRRTEFKRMLDDCNAGKIDIILTKSISRFARNAVDLLETVRHLKSIGVEVRFEKENINSLSADGELLLSILAGFSEEESRSQSENAKWAIQKRFAAGKQWHTAAYGYKWNGETFVIQPNEAEAVRVIFDSFLNDVPLRHTAKWLKENGHACSVPFIRYVLENPVYVGDVILQRYITENPRTHKIIKNTGQLPRYLVTDNHEPIISRETFEAVQAKIKENYEFNPAAHRVVKPSCFSAKIICGKCGNHYTKGLTKTNRFDGLQEHWICFGKLKNKVKFCNSKGIRGSRLREVCCEVLDMKEFDENIFGKMVEKIVTTETDELIFHFYDGTVKTANIKYFSSAKGKTFKYPLKKPFGYKITPSGYEIIPEEAEAVRLMYKYYADGWKIADISRELESKGYKSYRGKLSRRIIGIALDSDFYIGGKIVQAQTPYELDVKHEPIINKELFEIVQRRRVIELKKQERRIATRRRMDDEKRNGHSGERQ